MLTSIELKNNIISITIMPNDTVKYPEDGFENMKVFSKLHKFPPYLLDYNQDVAKFNAYVHQISLPIIKIKNYNIGEDYLK